MEYLEGSSLKGKTALGTFIALSLYAAYPHN